AVLRAGDTGSVSLTVFSSARVSSIECMLHLDETRLTNIAIEALVPELATDLRQTSNSSYNLSFTAASGRALQGTAPLARLRFATLPGQTSAFVPLRIRSLACTRADSGLTPTPLSDDGRVVIIGEHPLLHALLGGAGQRDLMLYGRPGAIYTIESSTDVTRADAWAPWRQVTLTNLFDRVSLSNSQPGTLFLRARE